MKLRTILISAFIVLILIVLGGFGYFKNDSNTKISQEKVLDSFITTFYNNQHKDELNDEEFIDSFKSTLSSDYTVKADDLDDLVYPPKSDTTPANYSGYRINKTSEEKVDGKTSIVYTADIYFIHNDESNVSKKLSIDLTKENNEWKINKITTR